MIQVYKILSNIILLVPNLIIIHKIYSCTEVMDKLISLSLHGIQRLLM